MKKILLYTMVFAASVFGLTSCGDDDSKGKSRITYFPTIELKGGTPYLWPKGTAWEDPGYVSLMGGQDVTDLVTVTGKVNTDESGLYTLSYATTKNEDGFGSSTTRDVVVVDPNDAVEGLYWITPESYRLRAGAKVEYGKSYPIQVFNNGDGTYSVDDLLGGWYYYRAGYGIDYALGGSITVADDGAVTINEAGLPGWGDSYDAYNITFDKESGTFTMTVTYAAMDFVQTWVKQQ